MKQINNFMKVMTVRWKEASVMIAILIFAGIITIIRPFEADTVSYFSDVTTPLVIIVAVLLIIVGINRKVM